MGRTGLNARAALGGMDCRGGVRCSPSRRTSSLDLALSPHAMLPPKSSQRTLHSRSTPTHWSICPYQRLSTAQCSTHSGRWRVLRRLADSQLACRTSSSWRRRWRPYPRHSSTGRLIAASNATGMPSSASLATWIAMAARGCRGTTWRGTILPARWSVGTTSAGRQRRPRSWNTLSWERSTPDHAPSSRWMFASGFGSPH